MKAMQIKDASQDRFREFMEKGNRAYAKNNHSLALEFFEKASKDCFFIGDSQELLLTLLRLGFENEPISMLLLKHLESETKAVVDHAVLAIILADTHKQKALFHLRAAKKMAKTELELSWFKDARERIENGII